VLFFRSGARIVDYSTDARLADYSTATRWHRRYIIHQCASRRSRSRNGKPDAYSRRSENRPGKGGIRITRSRRSGMHSTLRQPWPVLAAKTAYVRLGRRSVRKRRKRWTERLGRMPFRAEVPERVDRKVRENAVPCRSAGAGWPKGRGIRWPEGRESRMETGCFHRKVGTGHQTQDVKSPPEYGWHREKYDVMTDTT
jgi:hypothetical protein